MMATMAPEAGSRVESYLGEMRLPNVQRAFCDD